MSAHDVHELAVKIFRRINTETRCGTNRAIHPDSAVDIIEQELRSVLCPPMSTQPQVNVRDFASKL